GSVYVNGKGAPAPTLPPSSSSSEQDAADQPIVVGGLTVSAAPQSGNNKKQEDTQPNIPLATIGGQTIAQRPNGAVIIDGTTVSLGASPVLISGTPVSLNPSALIIDGTQIISRPTHPPLSPITTIAGEVLSQNADGAIVIDGQTISAGGPAITLSGTPISISIFVSNQDTYLMQGTHTIPFPTANAGTNTSTISTSLQTSRVAQNGTVMTGPRISNANEPTVVLRRDGAWE
ncbi:MAG: hypothetical protein Q9169_008287, partial [Polycauliona sp. 2 TL-2023]